MVRVGFSLRRFVIISCYEERRGEEEVVRYKMSESSPKEGL